MSDKIPNYILTSQKLKLAKNITGLSFKTNFKKKFKLKKLFNQSI